MEGHLAGDGAVKPGLEEARPLVLELVRPSAVVLADASDARVNRLEERKRKSIRKLFSLSKLSFSVLALPFKFNSRFIVPHDEVTRKAQFISPARKSGPRYFFVPFPAALEKKISDIYLSTVYVLDGGLPEEEVDVVVVLEGAHEVGG